MHWLEMKLLSKLTFFSTVAKQSNSIAEFILKLFGNLKRQKEASEKFNFVKIVFTFRGQRNQLLFSQDKKVKFKLKSKHAN